MLAKYATVNVLADNEVREGMNAYSDWPTFPQLYIRGEFVGGADIVKQMHESGQLRALLGDLVKPAKAPAIVVTPAAATALQAALADADPGDVIHIGISDQWDHALDIGPKDPAALTVTTQGLTLQIDAALAARAEGLVIDFVASADGGGFRLDNPNRPARVQQLSPTDCQQMLQTGKLTHLFDVRTPAEHQTAHVAAATLMNETVQAQLAALPKDTPIAFMCHHGGRSQAAAEYYLKQGFRTVYNIAGGIDAWAQSVDRTVPRY